MIKGQKLVTYLLKCCGNGGRRVSWQVYLKKRGVISQKCEKNGGNKPKSPKKRKKIIEGQKIVTYLPKCRGNGGGRVSQRVHLKKGGVISQKAKKNRGNRPKKRKKSEKNLSKGRNSSHTCRNVAEMEGGRCSSMCT